MQGVYLSRGRTEAQIQADQEKQELIAAMPLNVKLSRGLADDAVAHMGAREDALNDVIGSLAFLRDAAAVADDVSGYQLSCILGLIRTGVIKIQEEGDPAIHKLEASIRNAVTPNESNSEQDCVD
jgi:hypothetical protein